MLQNSIKLDKLRFLIVSILILNYFNFNAQSIDPYKIETNTEDTLVKLLYSNSGYSISNFLILENSILIYSEFSHVFVLLDKKTHVQEFTLDLIELPKIRILKVPIHLLDGSTILLQTPYSLESSLNLNQINDTVVSTGVVNYRGKECIMNLIIKDSIIKPFYEEIDFNFPLEKKETFSKSEFKNYLDQYIILNENYIYSFSIQSPFHFRKDKKKINSNLLLARNSNKNKRNTLFINYNERGLINGNSLVIHEDLLLFTALKLDTLVIFDKKLMPIYKGNILNNISFPEPFWENSIVYNELLQDKGVNKLYVNTIVLNYRKQKITSYDYYISSISLNENGTPDFDYLFKVMSETDLIFNNQLYSGNIYFTSKADVFDNHNDYSIYSIPLTKVPRNKVLKVKQKIRSKESNLNLTLGNDDKFILLKEADRIKLFHGIVQDKNQFPQSSPEKLIESIQKCSEESRIDYLLSYLMLMDLNSYNDDVKELAFENNFSFLIEKLKLLTKNFDKRMLTYNEIKECWEFNTANTVYSFYKDKNSWYLLGVFTSY